MTNPQKDSKCVPDLAGNLEQMSAAIYTLANDKTLDWLFGLVGSLKSADCELSINIIPFDKKISNLRKSIKNWQGVQLWEPQELEKLDEIGLKICRTEQQYSRNVFRKLATFWCPHEVFIYLDTDIVVGGNPEHWAARYKKVCKEVDIVAMDDDWRWVFRPGRLSEEFLRDNRAAVNSGFWIGRQGLISFADVIRAADSAERYRDEMMDVGEQSFWNYLMWQKSIVVRTFPVLGSEFIDWAWATHRIARRDGRGFVQWSRSNSTDSDTIFIVPFLHWAGFKLGPKMVNWHIYLKAALSAADSSGKLRLLWRFCRLNPKAFLSSLLQLSLSKLAKLVARRKPQAPR